MIPFNRPPYTGNEKQHVLQAMSSEKISGDGPYGKRCQNWFERELGCEKALLTPSCTAALEIAAILINIKPGDEVIMPSYTFVSTANAFVLRGAKIVFIDIRPDTMNIDEKLIEIAITSRTKAIVPVHYAGVSCEMDVIMEISGRYGLYVIEDAAQGMMSSYKGKPLGTIGHLGVFSFHETKNYSSGGEGGLLIINDKIFSDRSEIIREKGTNRSSFFKGVVDKYSWVDIGGSHLMNEISAAYLWGQLEMADTINLRRIKIWNLYRKGLSGINLRGDIKLEFSVIPDGVIHNAHMFYMKLINVSTRDALIYFLKAHGVLTVFHYIPLHTSIGGVQYGVFNGDDNFTTLESERLVRLPIYNNLGDGDIATVIKLVKKFYEDR